MSECWGEPNEDGCETAVIQRIECFRLEFSGLRGDHVCSNDDGYKSYLARLFAACWLFLEFLKHEMGDSRVKLCENKLEKRLDDQAGCSLNPLLLGYTSSVKLLQQRCCHV